MSRKSTVIAQSDVRRLLQLRQYLQGGGRIRVFHALSSRVNRGRSVIRTVDGDPVYRRDLGMLMRFGIVLQDAMTPEFTEWRLRE